MNQLCVPVPSAADTHRILDEVFALCRIPWIYDFIFRADPAADISMLLAPVQKRHALSARIFVNATETSSKYAHTFDFSKELMFYSIPAFSIGPITAGFCVEQPAHAAKKEDPTETLQCIRFIRDDRLGVFLHVSENKRTGVTEVDCLTHRSSTRRTRVRMKFDMHSLRSVLRTPRGILYPADIAPSLIYVNVSDEKRACPICKDPTATHCACVLPLRRPHHPLDFQFEAGNMGLYTGFYQGATVVRLCSAGHCAINATLQSGSVIQGELNGELTTRLHKLAVMDRLALVKEHPAAMVMPGSPLQLPAFLPDTTISEAQAIAATVDPVLPPKPLDSDVLFVQTPDVSTGDLGAANALMNTDEIIAHMNDGRADTNPPEQIERADLAVAESQEQSLVDKKEGASHSENACVDGSGDSFRDKSAGDGSISWDSNSNKAERDAVTTTSGGEEHDDDHITSPTAAVESQQSNDQKQAGQASKRRMSEVDKAEIRKKRNREAAARSNLKRKLRNESVRRDLASLTQRAIRLRVKEMMLRDENTRLRTALRKSGVSLRSVV